MTNHSGSEDRISWADSMAPELGILILMAFFSVLPCIRSQWERPTMKLKFSWLTLATIALAVLLISLGFGQSGLQAHTFSPASPPESSDLLIAQRPPRSDYFRAPFRGSFRYTNGFDHDIPQQFRDTNGYVVTWQDAQLSVGAPGASIDGHEGYDWRMPVGTPLIAVGNGTVEFAGEGRPFTCPPLGNRTVTGLYVYITHTLPSGMQVRSEYAHLSRIDVRPGSTARAGQVIGLSGNTGCSTAPHLHFAVRRLNGTNTGRPTLIDPYGWSGSRPDPWEIHPEGASSSWLWASGQAPRLFTN